MKKSKKIGLVIIPIAVLIGIFFGVNAPNNDVSFPLDGELDATSPETSKDIISLLDLPIIGSADAPVTIIAFNDYQCSACKTWYDNEYPVISKNLIDTGKANLLFLDSAPLGDDSSVISQATFCAEEQGKYTEYQEILFRSQQKIDDWAKPDQLKDFATELDLDLGSFDRCLDSGKYKNKILTNIDFTEKYGVERIPLFKIINFEGREHILKGGLPRIAFEDVVNRFQ